MVRVEFPTPAPTRDHTTDVALCELTTIPQVGWFFELNSFEFVVRGVMLTPQREYDALVELRA